MKAPGPTAQRRAAKARARAAHYRTVCRAVDARDGTYCRICSGWLLRGAHHHHIVYRSRGGTDTTNNLIRVCGSCHQRIHDKRLTVTGDGDGQIQQEAV